MRALYNAASSQLALVESTEGYDLTEWTDLGDIGRIDPALAVYDAASGTVVENIEPLRDRLLASLDAAAEATRLQFITGGSGQGMTYQYKVSEALAWTADNTASVPFLTAEATARSMTVAALVAEVQGNAAAWTVIGSKIEAARMGAKTAVRTATTAAAMISAAAVDWQGVTS